MKTKINGIDNKLDRAVQINEAAVKALLSAKSAHHRLNKIEDNQNTALANIRQGYFFGAIAFFIVADINNLKDDI